MKKAISVCLSLVMSMSLLCSCSKDDKKGSSKDKPIIHSNTSIVIGEEIKTDERLLSELEEKINENREQTVIIDAADMDYPIYFYTTHDGNNVYTRTIITGSEMNILSNEGGTYILDGKKKRYYKDETAIPTYPVNYITTQLADSTSYLGTYNVTVISTDYVAEKYKDDIGFTYFVFYTDGTVMAMLSQLEEGGPVVVTPTTITAEATDEKLKLPKDYTAMTAEEYVDFYNRPSGFDQPYVEEEAQPESEEQADSEAA